ncbi:MAG: GNAT family N-acetyltransferase [Gammaproteobacteria bacterium]
MRVFTQVRLTTPRLVLRPLHKSDAPDLFALRSDPKVMRYWSNSPWTSIDKAYELIARDEEAMATGQYIHLGLERKNDEQLIGTCTLFKLSEQCRRAEIGYGLASSAWRQGYMHEALVALLNYGFAELGLNRVEADIDPDNVASARSLLRLDFKKEGHLRERWIVDEQVSDSDLYGLLFSEWHTDSDGTTDQLHS